MFFFKKYAFRKWTNESMTNRKEKWQFESSYLGTGTEILKNLNLNNWENGDNDYRKINVSSRGRVGLRDHVMSVVQDEGHLTRTKREPFFWPYSYKMAQKGVGTCLFHSMAPVQGILETRWHHFDILDVRYFEMF